MKARLIPSLFSIVTILLTGCMVGPNYVKPSTPMAPAFKEEAPNLSQANDGWKLAQPGDQTPVKLDLRGRCAPLVCPIAVRR